MQPKKIKVLFLPAWYPHKNDSMAGLFVKYHAFAVLNFADVAVLHITPDPNQKKGIEYNYHIEGQLKTVIAYIRKNGTIDKYLYPLRYLWATIKGYGLIKKVFGKPDINHVHILTRSGLWALYKKITTGTPYIITEHWSRYLPQNSGSYSGTLRKWLTRRVAKNASAITTVSTHLGVAMQQHQLTNKYLQISNVVNVGFFSPLNPKPQNPKPVLLHVSCFDEKPKNVKGILDAAKQLTLEGFEFELRLVGDGKDHQMCVDYANELGLTNVVFTGLKTGTNLLAEYQKADVFVLFSNFENQPVVLIEAFACGLPVIATKVGGIPEIVQPERGILIDAKDKKALIDAIKSSILHPEQFNKAAMQQYAHDNFSYEGVGRKFFEVYKQTLNL
ncbi:MAG: glycosyltransferase family 4 protein [Bacteroidetes bacterium]|nr:MAG: glycosyltransferase family 4 protein [Bacteroidota bacterium]